MQTSTHTAIAHRIARLSRYLFAAPSIALAAFVFAGCPQVDGDIVEPPVVVNECTKNSNCPEGFICVGGSCDIGDCDPTFTADTCGVAGALEDPDIGPYCCRIFQVCGFDRTCQAVEDGPFGGQCETAEDCPDPGQFCSAGFCYDAAGRTSCTGSFQ